MGLVQPSQLREKVLLIGAGKVGKSTAWLSIAYWAWKSNDPRKFICISTDDEAIEDVLLDEKYQGILAEDGGNLTIHRVVDWEEYQEAGDKAVAAAEQGDWIVVDFITHAWPAVQAYYLREITKKSRSQMLMEGAKSGAKGWDLFRDMDWSVVNSLYDEFIKPMLLRSRAHLFFVAEEDPIFEGSKTTEEQKAHIREFGKFRAKGQKALPFQCRSYLRLQRLARGRVLHTLGDRARTEMNGEDMSDFFLSYMAKVAGWAVEMPAD